MERIQNAIAKARATREGRDPETASRNATASQAPVTPPDAVQAAWQAVPSVGISRKKLRERRVVAFESGKETAEFDRLRTRILQRMQAEGWTRLAIVSPTAQNGKSTIAANLALSCARQKHLNVLLLELDLRRPGMASVLNLPKDLDVSRVLVEQADLSDHAVRLQDNLIVAPTLPVHTGAGEVLQSPQTSAALDGVAQTYAPSITLFDMPPMEAGDDVIGFLSNVDCALIVVAAGITTLDEIEECEREVGQRTSVMGIALNKCQYEPKSGGYGYYS